jgi:hypothetical protein
LIPWVLFTKSGFLLDRLYYYTEILERLRKRVMQGHPNILKNWILYHSYTAAHAALSVAQFMTLKCITVMPQPPY